MILIKKIIKKDHKFTAGDQVTIWKYIKNIIPWTYVIKVLNGQEIVGTFYEKEFEKTNQKDFRVEKVIKGKGDKISVKWKGYGNSFNSWIDKKDIVI